MKASIKSKIAKIEELTTGISAELSEQQRSDARKSPALLTEKRSRLYYEEAQDLVIDIEVLLRELRSLKKSDCFV